MAPPVALAPGVPRAWNLARGTQAAALAAAVLLGVAVSAAPGLTLGAVALPLLLAFVVARPEWILILFLSAGIYKQDPRITAVLPFDVTVVMGSLLCLALVVHAIRRPVRIPPQALLLVPLVAMVAQGVVGRASDYGAEKALRFCTLTLLATAGTTVLLAERQRLERFLVALACIGFFLCVDATLQPQTTSEGRLTAHGSNPIALARIGAFTLAFGWIRFHFARRALDKLLFVGVLGVACLCVLAAGSRGPVLSIVLGMALLSLLTAAKHGRAPVGIGTMLLVAGLGLLVVTFAAIPSLPLHRFQLLFSEDKGTSIFLRGMLFATAWKLTLAHPLGLGVGGFARHAVLDLKYPHNLFLEVGCELGWIPLACLVVLVGWSLKALWDILSREYRWSGLFLGIVVLAATLNSMVTGDLNDNRLLFATLLLPFVYRRFLATPREDLGGATCPRLAADPPVAGAPSPAGALADAGAERR